jgi:hypothetical protein
MRKYGNPEQPNKYELATRRMILSIESAIRSWLIQLGDSPGRSIRIDPELYYDDGGQPSCFLEIHLGPSSSFRVGIQRNSSEKQRSAWTCGWNLYAKGSSIAEGEFDASGISQIGPELTNKILAQYAYLIR